MKLPVDRKGFQIPNGSLVRYRRGKNVVRMWVEHATRWRDEKILLSGTDEEGRTRHAFAAEVSMVRPKATQKAKRERTASSLSIAAATLRRRRS